MLIVSTVSPFICHEMTGPDAMILALWILSFKQAFSPSSFIFIKRLFSGLFTFCHKNGVICISWEFIFLGSKVTADDCSYEITRHFLLGRKPMTNLVSILKSRDITLPTKVHIVKAMVFLVAMYGCESWIIKKAQCWRIDGFELWSWSRFLKSLGLQRDVTSPS